MNQDTKCFEKLWFKRQSNIFHYFLNIISYYGGVDLSRSNACLCSSTLIGMISSLAAFRRTWAWCRLDHKLYASGLFLPERSKFLRSESGRFSGGIKELLSSCLHTGMITSVARRTGIFWKFFLGCIFPMMLSVGREPTYLSLTNCETDFFLYYSACMFVFSIFLPFP